MDDIANTVRGRDTYLDAVDANPEAAQRARPVEVENGREANVAHLPDADRGLLPGDTSACNTRTRCER